MGGLDVEEDADRLAVTGGGLRFTFRRTGERWEQILTIGDGQDVVAASLEGDGGHDTPARVMSPAFQDVQRHPSECGVVLLATGQSVPHHFSAVVTVAREAGRVSIAFDLADRCRSTVEVLAATYLVSLASGDLVDAGPERIVWSGPALGGGRLELSADDGHSVALAEAGRRATRVQALARIAPSTHTQRLQYRWHWTPADPNL